MVREENLKIITGMLDGACMETFGHPLSYYVNRSHRREYSDVRQMSARLLYDAARLPFVDIAACFGQHHTTVIYGYYKSGDMLRNDAEYRRVYGEYEKHFKNSLCKKSVI